MSNYKRKRPKEHRFVDCCKEESWKSIGNDRFRISHKDKKRPQLYRDDEYHVAESSSGKDACFVIR